MVGIIVRRAGPADLEALATLIDGFAKGHPAENHVRSVDRMRDAFFGPQAVAHVLLAESDSGIVGFGAWRRTYDVFWSLLGGEGLALYVAPFCRGRGVALRIVTAMCAEIRTSGGCFLETTYDPQLAPLYERVAVGRPARSGHLSALAFARMADMAGQSPREIVRGLPSRDLNYAPG